MYTGELFETEARTIHMGIDIGAPIGTPIFAFDNGRILHQGFNPEPFDYGHVIVTEHQDPMAVLFWVLLGHLSKDSIIKHEQVRPSKRICLGMDRRTNQTTVDGTPTSTFSCPPYDQIHMTFLVSSHYKITKAA